MADPPPHRPKGKVPAEVSTGKAPGEAPLLALLERVRLHRMPAYRYCVSGRVQGVGYRYFALREAEALGIAGFARNLPDGKVEVVAEGADEALARFADRLRQGPPFATVTSVERVDSVPRGDAGFHIR
jgi:acylphosphatase